MFEEKLELNVADSVEAREKSIDRGEPSPAKESMSEKESTTAHAKSEDQPLAILLPSAKLRRRGQMAAGVAHELKNLFHLHSLHLQTAEQAVARGNTRGVEESIVEMKQLVVRGVEMVDRLLAYSRQTDVELERSR